jgi:imidazolonepropionase-like amidohydrolase
MTSVLIVNASIWKWNDLSNQEISGHVEQNSWITMKNGRITEVGGSTPAPSYDVFDKVIDVKGKLLLPGLIGETKFNHMQ